MWYLIISSDFQLALLATAFLVFFAFFFRVNRNVVPTVLPGTAFGTFCEYVKSVFWLKSTTEEGYKKFHGQPFKVPEPGRWRVMISNRAHLEEIRKASDTMMGVQETLNEIIASEYTMGPMVTQNGFHFAVVRTHLARDYGILLPNMLDELSYAFERVIPNAETHWTAVPALHTMTVLVCRLTARVLAGPSISKNEEFLNIAYHHAEQVMQVATLIKFLPKFMRSFAVRYFTPLPSALEKATSILRPTIEYRIRQSDTYGTSWPGKPDDMLSWLIDIAEGELKTAKVLTEFIMAISFAATHTTSMTLTHALYQLSITRECIDPIREEIMRVVKDEGYTKVAFSRMKLLDSFIKETMRYHGIWLFSTARVTLKDFTFSDGTFLPAGTHLAANAASIHHDELYYKDAHKFIPFRFVSEDGAENIKSNATTATSDFLAFGYGKHSCPGRYFAIIEIKAIMAQIILNYDFEIAGNKDRFPKSMHILAAIVPNPFTKLSFRRRS